MKRVKKLQALQMMFQDWPQTKQLCGNAVQFEQQLRDYIRWRGDIAVFDQRGNNILENDITNAAEYTKTLLRKNFSNDLEYDNGIFIPKGTRPRPKPGPGRNFPDDPDFDDDFDPDPRPNPIGFDLPSGSLFPWIKDHLLLVILVIALLMFFSKGGLRTVSRLVSGLVSGLLPIALGAAALFGIIYLIRRGSFGFFRDVKLKPLLIVVAVIAGLVFLYEALGPAAYAIVMNGGLAKLLFFVFALAATIGILKSKNMGWPIGVKLVVIGVFWLVLLKT